MDARHVEALQPNRTLNALANASVEPNPTETATLSIDNLGCPARRIAAISSRRLRT